MRVLVCFVLAGSAAVCLAQEKAAQSAPAADGLHPRVKMVTTLGDIVLELDATKAPITVDNFIQYAQDKFYDGLIFHRVIKTFMIQGGGYTPNMEERTEGLRPPIKNEWRNGLKNERGAIAMARTRNPDSATAQFFINVVDNAPLDAARPQTGNAGYCVFGKVVEGMDVVDKIRDTEVGTNPKLPMGPVVPTKPVIIKHVEVIGPYDRDKVKTLIAKSSEQALAAVRAAWPDDVKKFIADNEEKLGQKVHVKDSGLAYFVLKSGDGPQPKPSDRVMTHYTGWLIDGTKFDSSVDRGKPFQVNLRGGVIQGWLLALRDMKVGEKRKIILPPELAYGQRGAPPKIPPNAYLVFDVELLEIK